MRTHKPVDYETFTLDGDAPPTGYQPGVGLTVLDDHSQPQLAFERTRVDMLQTLKSIRALPGGHRFAPQAELNNRPGAGSTEGKADSPLSRVTEENPMKAWVITFVDQKGERTSLSFDAEQQPSIEEAARVIRAHLYPVVDKADLNDFEGRVSMPTAEWLKQDSGVEIKEIKEQP